MKARRYERQEIGALERNMRAKKPEILVTFLILLISLANTAGAYQVTLVGNTARVTMDVKHEP
jgi:hypothetical protein